jgi:HTH-type transcriptional regulator, competence development regulator
MLTPFGKEVRKLRIDHDPPMKLKDLADQIGVSSAYLSSVETGAKSAAPGLVDKVADALEVDSEVRRNLHRLASESVKVVQLDLTHGGAQAKDLAMTFARRFPSLDDEQVSALLRIIERDDNTPAKSGAGTPTKRRK